MSEETWLLIPNFSNYECSELGRIRNKITKRILKPQQNKKGYERINLIDNNNKICKKQVHRIIALTWLENTENKPTVDHLNAIKNCNILTNLRWATNKEQCKN